MCASPPGLQRALWFNSTRFLDSDFEPEKHSHMCEKNILKKWEGTSSLCGKWFAHQIISSFCLQTSNRQTRCCDLHRSQFLVIVSVYALYHRNKFSVLQWHGQWQKKKKEPRKLNCWALFPLLDIHRHSPLICLYWHRSSTSSLDA